jgi:hypothetical protein
MRLAIQICNYLIGLPLELLIIAALLRGAYRRFPIILVYTIAYFLTTVVEIPVYIAYYSGVKGVRGYRVFLYWLDEGILQLLIFAVVMSLIYQASARVGSRRILRAGLIVGAIFFAGISFLLHYNRHIALGLWMTPWTRDLSFCSTILDLALWALLIASRKKDHLLLMLSGALGIQFTGEAIGESLRNLSNSPVAVNSGDIMIVLADFLCLYIWWQAFRGAARAGAK